MLFDERIAELLERKCTYVSGRKDPDFLPEAIRLTRWFFSEEMIRPYAFELLAQEDFDRARFVAHRTRTIEEAAVLRDRLTALYLSAVTDEANVDEYGFEYQASLKRFVKIHGSPPSQEREDDELERDPEKDSTLAGKLVEILKTKEATLRGADEDLPKLGLRDDIDTLRRRHVFRYQERKHQLEASPGRSLRRLCVLFRILNPPPEGEPDWIPFLKPGDRQDALLQALWKQDGELLSDSTTQARLQLKRVCHELRSLLGTTLSSLAMISRFKERCTWFDKHRMRSIASGVAGEKGVREDRLTMELARYLHDNGIFSLVRSRMANLEPDVIAPFGPRRLAVESKVYAKGESARGAVLHGFWQLHAYLTSLETKTVYAHEGFLVVFRLGGGICDAPGIVTMNRFRIYIVPIDLGEREDSGHAQPKPSHIDAADLIEIAGQVDPPKEEDTDTP